MDVYDVIVIGAGIEGSSTAYHIANKGTRKVALVEQVCVIVSVSHFLCCCVLSFS